MKVIAWSQNLTPEAAAKGAPSTCRRTTSCATAISCPSTCACPTRTRGLVGARELALMRPRAYLVNTARGPSSTRTRWRWPCASAASPARRWTCSASNRCRPTIPSASLDNFIGTSHLGYVTEQSYEVYYGESVENIRAWIAGKPIRVLTSTQREIGYQSDPA